MTTMKELEASVKAIEKRAVHGFTLNSYMIKINVIHFDADFLFKYTEGVEVAS